MWQHEITQPIPLLNEKGELTQAGWARKPYPVYDRNAVKVSALRVKEWDYYLISNGRFALALTVADNGYMGLDSVSLLDFVTGRQVTRSPMRVLPLGHTGLPDSADRGVTASSGKGYGLTFLHTDGEKLGPARQLVFRMEDFWEGKTIRGSVTLFDQPDESVVTCTPFDKPGHFYYNRKINCLRASGQVELGEETYTFCPEDSFAVLDWGRGVWTYRNTWYWSSASGLAEGAPFGFNLGYGFGNGSAATENALIFGGKVHKLSHVKFHIPGKPGREDWLSPWTFTSDNGRLEMEFSPILDRAACTDLKILKSDQHQVFGRFTGRAVLDGGRVLEFRDLTGFAEKVVNRW
ncbi:DUF2804 domain-containing protein [Pseudoflavonifractor phocaeensis]|uniref:DUF2804 domain-containing protein n=1 Tax=Pseudoflavonifractor phocaeensis TaxID=1870988 RepID=UPI001F18D7F5|nr:DUF2804 domain-containing protein [Pseudoflavonifractor phocaeensis]MCF2661447.1 DUF2804 domain-containing protein [Pseudoflavonifractor phocaeensis]